MSSNDNILDLSVWITQYEVFMKSTGYGERSIAERLIYLGCFQDFLRAGRLSSLEQFQTSQVVDFIDYWVGLRPELRSSNGFKRKLRFAPAHHLAVQRAVRCFLRWAQQVGYLDHDLFTEPIQVHYFFPPTGDYLHFCREHRGLAESTLKWLELTLRRFDHFLHAQKVDDFKQLEAQHIDRFVQQQASTNSRRVQRLHGVLRGFFRYLFSRGMLDRDWAICLRSPRQYSLAHTPRALDRRQVLHLLDSIDRKPTVGKRDFAVILMACTLGVRAGEMATVCLQDLDWKRQTIRLYQSKNHHWLLLPLPPLLMKALADYLKNGRPQNTRYRQLFLGVRPPVAPLKPRSVSSLIATRMQQAGIAGSGHQLRHSLASELLRAGVPYPTLQELLGHRYFTSTLVYTKIDLKQLSEVADNDAQHY